MIRVLEGQDFADGATFAKALNKERLANRKSWIVYVGAVAGKAVEIKTYDCGYLQIFRIDGINHGGQMDMKPTAWQETIREALA